MAQDYHPDGGNHADTERMKRINIAFEILSNPLTKQRFDAAYRMRQQRTTGFTPPPPPHGGSKASPPPPPPPPSGPKASPPPPNTPPGVDPTRRKRDEYLV